MDAEQRQPGRQAPDEAGLDAVIDAVAREMTDAGPSGALRARVLEEIAKEARPPVALPRWAWAGAAAVLLMAVATSVWLVRPVSKPGGTPVSITQQRPPAAAAPVLAGAGAASSAASSGPSPAPSARPVPGRLAAQDIEPPSPDSHHLPALAEIQPLSFAAVEPAALQIADVEVASLTAMPNIEIPSLESGSNELQPAGPKKENQP